MIHHISYFINQKLTNIMEHTPFKISMKSLQLLPDFMVVYYDELTYPIERHFFVHREAAVKFFRSSIDMFERLHFNDQLSTKVSYIRLLSIHCIEDVYQYTSSAFCRLTC